MFIVYSNKCIFTSVLFLFFPEYFYLHPAIIDLIPTILSSSSSTKAGLQNLRTEPTWRHPSGPWCIWDIHHSRDLDVGPLCIDRTNNLCYYTFSLKITIKRVLIFMQHEHFSSLISLPENSISFVLRSLRMKYIKMILQSIREFHFYLRRFQCCEARETRQSVYQQPETCDEVTSPSVHYLFYRLWCLGPTS